MEFLGKNAETAQEALKNHVIPDGAKCRELHHERNWYCRLDERFCKAVYETFKRSFEHEQRKSQERKK